MTTELKVLKHAKTYIDSLSHGVNPLNKQPVPEDSVLNQVNLKKCFTYVSTILQKVIDGEVNMAVELRVLKHANNYIKALSRGVDPLGKRPAPGDVTLNQVNLKKCFAYVSGILQKVIEDEEALQSRSAPPRTPRRTEHAAPPVSAAEPDLAALLAEAGFPDCVPLLEGTPSLTQTRQNIAVQLDRAGLIQPTVNAYHEWLTREEILLPPAEPDGPWPVTERGRSLGFSQAEERSGKDLTWTLCAPEAQRLLTKNLAEIYQIRMSHLDRLQAAASPEAMARVACSNAPVTLKALADLCNEVLPMDLPQKLSYPFLAPWLEKEGFLEKSLERPGQVGYVPSARGTELGLSTREESRRTVIYSRAAQEYITAHLPEIIDFMRNIRKPPKPVFSVPEGLQIAHSITPQSLTAFSNQVNEALTARGGVSLLRGAIRTWLIQEGYLELIRCADGKSRYLPGNAGEAIGLQTEEAGERIFIQLPESAQSFIFDHLDSICEMLNQL